MKGIMLLAVIGLCAWTVMSLPHDGHADHKHEPSEAHSSGHSHHAPGEPAHDHNHNDKEKGSMDACHAKPEAADCSETVKNKFVFEHLNATHHVCKQMPDDKCSSSSNAFETLELCEKSCHHDDHH